MTNKYKEYLASKEWADIKVELFLSRGRKCERCGSSNTLNVHHKTYEHIFHEEPEDLEILCRTCHLRLHGLWVFKPKKYRMSKKKLRRLKREKKKKQKVMYSIRQARRQIRESAKRRGFI